MTIDFMADQATYNEWYAALVKRAEDPNDDLHLADVMDANNIFALAQHFGNTYPDKRPLLVEHTSAAVEQAMTELGTFIGARNLAKLIGLPPEEGEQTMAALFGSKVRAG